jgi:hypothetical protein
MADRQLFQLTTRTLGLTDVFGSQDNVGASEQGKNTLQTLKDLILLGLPISTAKRLVIRVDNNLVTYSGTIMENDFPGLTIVSMLSSGVDTGLNIRVSTNIFVAGKANFLSQSIISGVGSYYIVHTRITASDQINVLCVNPNSNVFASLPNFYFLNILIYP